MSEKIVHLNEEVIKSQISELVRGSVEETLNELLEKTVENIRFAHNSCHYLKKNFISLIQCSF